MWEAENECCQCGTKLRSTPFTPLFDSELEEYKSILRKSLEDFIDILMFGKDRTIEPGGPLLPRARQIPER